MQCFGKYKGDRVCDLCETSNNDIYKECRGQHDKERNLANKLWDIKSKCPHVTECWDEYTPFDGCNKNGGGYGRFADGCRPSLECEKYIKNKGSK